MVPALFENTSINRNLKNTSQFSTLSSQLCIMHFHN